MYKLEKIAANIEGSKLDTICHLLFYYYSGSESEYRSFEYWKHLNTKLFEAQKSNGVVFKWSF